MKKTLLLFLVFLFSLRIVYGETFYIDDAAVPLSVSFSNGTDTLHQDMETVPIGLEKRGFTFDDARKMLHEGKASIVNFDFERSEYIAITIDREIKDDEYYFIANIQDYMSDIEPLDNLSIVTSRIGYFARRYIRVSSLNRYQVLYAKRLNKEELLLINCVKLDSKIDEESISHFDNIVGTINFANH